MSERSWQHYPQRVCLSVIAEHCFRSFFERSLAQNTRDLGRVAHICPEGLVARTITTGGAPLLALFEKWADALRITASLQSKRPGKTCSPPDPLCPRHQVKMPIAAQQRKRMLPAERGDPNIVGGDRLAFAL